MKLSKWICPLWHWKCTECPVSPHVILTTYLSSFIISWLHSHHICYLMAILPPYTHQLNYFMYTTKSTITMRDIKRIHYTYINNALNIHCSQKCTSGLDVMWQVDKKVMGYIWKWHCTKEDLIDNRCAIISRWKQDNILLTMKILVILLHTKDQSQPWVKRCSQCVILLG